MRPSDQHILLCGPFSGQAADHNKKTSELLHKISIQISEREELEAGCTGYPYMKLERSITKLVQSLRDLEARYAVAAKTALDEYKACHTHWQW